jgi:hypothetical protein
MKVRFVEGPLDGEMRDLPEAEVTEGSVLEMPSGFDKDHLEIPGDETVLSYLYEGDGVARYIAGVTPD